MDAVNALGTALDNPYWTASSGTASMLEHGITRAVETVGDVVGGAADRLTTTVANAGDGGPPVPVGTDFAVADESALSEEAQGIMAEMALSGGLLDEP